MRKPSRGLNKVKLLGILLLVTTFSACHKNLQQADMSPEIVKITQTEPPPRNTSTLIPPALTKNTGDISTSFVEITVAPTMPESQSRSNPMTISIVFDNTSMKTGLESSWGFSALVEYQNRQVLFDTGGSGTILLTNMEKMEIDPLGIDAVVLSHHHQDHTGGLPDLLGAGARPIVYLLPSFSSGYQKGLAKQVEVVEVSPHQQIAPRMYSTGEISGNPPEQALVLDTTHGLVIITGCAHPGVERITRQAKRDFQEDIYLVLGGFHLGSASTDRIQKIIKEFQEIGVKNVAPCHCSGSQAMALFQQAFGDHYLEAGVGKVFLIENK